MSGDSASVASEYFSRMRARDASVVELFHDDATLVGLGTARTGKDAIREFYEGVIITTHGVTENGSYWSLPGVSAALANAGYRVLDMDMRGHGRSVPRGEPAGARWPHIEAVAEALLERGALSGTEVRGIVERVEQRPRRRAGPCPRRTGAYAPVPWNRPAAAPR